MTTRRQSNHYVTGADISFDVRNSSIANNAIVEKAKARLFFISFCFIAIFIVVIARIFELSVYLNPVVLSSPLEVNPIGMHMKRSDIVDRNNTIIATSLPVVNFYADASLIEGSEEAEKAARELVSILPELKLKSTQTKLNSERSFVYIKRNITPSEQFEINKLGYPAFKFEQAEYRVYPQGRLFSHILGYVDIDNKGIAGLELSFNKELMESKKPKKTSLDMRVQEAVHSQLKKDMDEYDATAAIAAVMDVNSGEILAMVSLPDFDANELNKADTKNLFNQASLGIYEVGSVFKLFNTAMAIESGKIKVTDRFDATKPFIMASHKISDFYAKNKWLDVEEILVYSSNIGSAKMALAVGKDYQQEFLRKIGFFDSIDLEISETATPLTPTVWRDINVATVSYGYGVAVSSLHVLRAVSAMVNGGRLYSMTLVPVKDSLNYTQVISNKTSRILRKLMRKVVTKGSGKSANIEGYLVGGKTGSARIIENGAYVSGKLRTSFIGAFPMNDPKYSIVVTLADPKRIEGVRGNTSGWNATKTAGEIIERIAPILGVSPDEDYKNTIGKNIMEVNFANEQ